MYRKCQLLIVGQLLLISMVTSELRQAMYSNTGLCSTDAPATVKSLSRIRCSTECLHLASCRDFNHNSSNNECSLFLHKPLFNESKPGCAGFKNDEDIACMKMGAVVPATISTACCSIPFTLNGNLHYSCTDNGTGDGCFYGNREWKQCRQLTDFRPVYVSTSTKVLSADPSVSVPLLTINGWILMQRKVTNGSVSFAQNWVEYRDGFGSPAGDDNYWLGLGKIYRLLQFGNVRLRIEIQRETGVWESVEYSSFAVEPESDKYRLSVSGFSGDTGDAIAAPVHPNRISNGMQFSSVDQDNDNNGGQCSSGGSGWWFKSCSRSDLNTDHAGCWNAYTDAHFWDVMFSRMLVKLD